MCANVRSTRIVNKLLCTIAHAYGIAAGICRITADVVCRTLQFEISVLTARRWRLLYS